MALLDAAELAKAITWGISGSLGNTRVFVSEVDFNNAPVLELTGEYQEGGVTRIFTAEVEVRITEDEED